MKQNHSKHRLQFRLRSTKPLRLDLHKLMFSRRNCLGSRFSQTVCFSGKMRSRLLHFQHFQWIRMNFGEWQENDVKFQLEFPHKLWTFSYQKSRGRWVEASGSQARSQGREDQRGAAEARGLRDLQDVGRGKGEDRAEGLKRKRHRKEMKNKPNFWYQLYLCYIYILCETTFRSTVTLTSWSWHSWFW